MTLYDRYDEGFSHGHMTASTSSAAEIARLRNCVNFFASVIKSGEPWTETCQRDYDAAMGTVKVPGPEQGRG